MSGEVASRVSTWMLRWTILWVLWLAFADSRALSELVAAAVAAAIGATFAGVIVRPGRPRTVRGLLALGGIGPRALLRPAWRLIADTAVLARGLWRRVVMRQRVTGSFRAARYGTGGPTGTAAGRAVAELYGSLTPNRYVVGIDDEEGVILVHELIRADEPLDPLSRP